MLGVFALSRGGHKHPTKKPPLRKRNCGIIDSYRYPPSPTAYPHLEKRFATKSAPEPSQASDFPPNVENLSIAQLLMYFIPADGASFQLQPTLSFTPSGTSASIGPYAAGAPGTSAPPVYVFSTRRGNASAWIPILGEGVTGNWTLTLPNNPATAGIFQNQQIQVELSVEE